MHLAMNTQKAVFKLVLHWASSLLHGPTLMKRLQPLVTHVQLLRLPYICVHMFKNDKFGGYVAENYRAITMLPPWLFRCVLEPEFAPAVLVDPDTAKPRSTWTRMENMSWLKLRGILVPSTTKALALKTLVNDYFQHPDNLPAICETTEVTPLEIRALIMLLYQVFGTLFTHDLCGTQAAHRFETLVVPFVDCVTRISSKLHPTKMNPIWLLKYGFLGLLRCRQHFFGLYVCSLTL